jgi:hypothetical protein
MFSPSVLHATLAHNTVFLRRGRSRALKYFFLFLRLGAQSAPQFTCQLTISEIAATVPLTLRASFIHQRCAD